MILLDNIEEEAMVNIDGTLFVQIANFIILIFVLNSVLYRPIRKILKEREEKVNGLDARPIPSSGFP